MCVARVDYDKQAARYDRARTIPPESIAVWMASARRHVDTAGVRRILDLGSGTGRFSAALADAFEADVIAVEPSAGMRAEAAPKGRDSVRRVGGRAEALPLADGTIDLAWLSNVVHHFDDLESAAREIGRVCREGSAVLVRGAFGGVPVPSLYRFFPSTQQVVDTFPAVPEVIGAFEAAGFQSFLSEQVSQILATNMTAMYQRLKLRADTTLEKISDEEFEAGLEAVKRAAETETGPVEDRLTLLVVR